MPSVNKDKRNGLNDSKRDINNYIRYSALGFQMFGIIALFTYIGYKIDENQNSKTPLYTAFFSLAGVFIALFQVIRSLKNNKS